jgi:hypothetical protein
MKQCLKCGFENEEKVEYCKNCGASFKDQIPEKICERRTIVYKPLVDESIAKLIGEQEKKRLFTKIGLFKSKDEETQFVSLDKYYEPYVIVKGTYNIDYCQEGVYHLNIPSDVREVIINDQIIKPEPADEGQKITLTGDERIKYQDKAYMIIDRKGNQVSLDDFPTAPSEENPEEILEQSSNKLSNLEIPQQKEVEIVRSKIVKRPPKIKRVISELFEISERVIVYVPFYELEYESTKTNEKKALRINAITSKLATET